MIELSKEAQEKLSTTGLTPSELKKIIDSDDIEFYLDFFALQGMELILKEDHYVPKQLGEALDQATFCIVDIETNGGKAHRDQIIELGAVIVKSGDILKSFNQLIQADKLPKSIAELTGITLDDLQFATPLKEIMQQFRAFVGTHTIVAHPLKFDYDFISSSFEQTDLGHMLNLGICNISLAERTLSSAKYGLHYLNRTLKLEEDFQQHRAYNDAIITKDIFQKALENLPENVKTVKDLIEFSKKGKKKPRAALIEFD